MRKNIRPSFLDPRTKILIWLLANVVVFTWSPAVFQLSVMVAADAIRVLLQLVGEERIGEDTAVCSPDIAPAGLPGVDGVGHKVCGVLGGWIGEGGDVQLYRPWPLGLK